MTKKSITIDLEAYKRLKIAKKPNESFSQTIKRVVRKPVDLSKLFAAFEADPASTEFVEAVEEQVAQRNRRSRRAR